MRTPSPKLKITVISLFVALPGCTTSTKPEGSADLSAMIEAETAIIDREIADASSYSNVLQPLAFRTTIMRPDYITDYGLLDIVNATYTGTVEEFVAKVALETGYRLMVEGEKPRAPILITLVKSDLPAIGALREALWQSKNRAELIVDQNSKTMKLLYARPERSLVPHLEDQVI
jgi:hypothetical protein